MDVLEYLRALLARWRTILVILLLCVGAASAAILAEQPTYKATETFFVSSANPEASVGNAIAASVYAQQQVLSYAAVASSARMAQTVIKDLDLNATPSEISGEVSDAVQFNTVIINLTVTDHSPTRALAIAQSIARNYDQVIRNVDSAGPAVGTLSPIRVSLLEGATLPTSPASPHVVLNLTLGIAAGLLLGIGGAALRDSLDDTVKLPGKLRNTTGLTVIGTVPINANKDELVIGPEDRGPFAEAIRQLRINLQFASLDEPIRSVIVTSPAPYDGKSLISLNLATACAAAGMKVILVDGDLRRPRLAEQLGVIPTVGMTSVLLGQVELDEALQPIVLPGLTLLPSGPLPPNPAEVMSSAAAAGLIDKLTGISDLVVVDTPPSGVFADARGMSAACDGVIVVAKYGSTRKSQLVEVVDSIRSIDSYVVGTVINLSPAVRGEDAYYGATEPARSRAPWLGFARRRLARR